ncbi:MAG: DUF2214 domain-containing protein [Geminicoccaceae bacterium]
MIAWIEASALATWLRYSTIAYPLLSAAHIAAIGALLTTALWLDTRLLAGTLDGLTTRLQRLSAFALIAAAGTGALLFSVSASDYLVNPAFRAKLALLAAALGNVALVHAGGIWRRSLETGAPGTALRLAALASLALWPCVLVAGRFIGFY